MNPYIGDRPLDPPEEPEEPEEVDPEPNDYPEEDGNGPCPWRSEP